MNKKLAIASRSAIVFGLLPALIIVGSQFWHAFLTGDACDLIYALTGLLLVSAFCTIVYLPYIIDKVLYGEEYGIGQAFLWCFVGLTLVMMFYRGHQVSVTGWYNPVPLYEAYVAVGIMIVIFAWAALM